MLKTVYLTTVLALLVTFLVGCSQEVQTGRIITCKRCSKEISNTVNVIKVPTWKAKEYRVSRESTYCDKCGSEKVAYEVKTRCEQCGKTYRTRTEYAMRRTNPRDKSRTDGFCTTSCQRVRKVDRTIDKVSEKTGDVLGRIGKGLFDGARRHTR